MLASLARGRGKADLGQQWAGTLFLNYLLALFKPEPYRFCKCCSMTEVLLKCLPALHSCSGENRCVRGGLVCCLEGLLDSILHCVYFPLLVIICAVLPFSFKFQIFLRLSET